MTSGGAWSAGFLPACGTAFQAVNGHGQDARATSGGFALLELIIALNILAVALAIGFIAFSQSVSARKQHDCRAAARDAVVLALERARALDGAALPAPGAKMELGLPAELASRLPGASCQLSIAPINEDRRLFRAQIEVRWKGAACPETGEAIVRAADAPRASGRPR